MDSPQTDAGVSPAAHASLPGVVALLSDAWKLYAGRFKTLIVISIFPVIAAAVFVIFYALPLFGLFLPGAHGFSPNVSAVSLIWLFPLLIVFLVFLLWDQVALLIAVSETEDPGVRGAFGKARHLLAEYVGLSLLSGFIIVGGTILFVVPGIIFYVWFSVWQFVMVKENDTWGMHALLKSKFYVSGRWWKVCGRLLALFALSAVLSILQNSAPNAVMKYFFYGVTFALGPLFLSYLFILYRALKDSSDESAFAPTPKDRLVPVIAGILGMFVLVLIVIALAASGVAKRAAPRPAGIPPAGTTRNFPHSRLTGRVLSLPYRSIAPAAAVRFWNWGYQGCTPVGEIFIGQPAMADRLATGGFGSSVYWIRCDGCYYRGSLATS